MRSLIDTLGQHLGSKPTGEGLVFADIIKTVLHCFLVDGTPHVTVFYRVINTWTRIMILSSASPQWLRPLLHLNDELCNGLVLKFTSVQCAVDRVLMAISFLAPLAWKRGPVICPVLALIIVLGASFAHL